MDEQILYCPHVTFLLASQRIPTTASNTSQQYWPLLHLHTALSKIVVRYGSHRYYLMKESELDIEVLEIP